MRDKISTLGLQRSGIFFENSTSDTQGNSSRLKISPYHASRENLDHVIMQEEKPPSRHHADRWGPLK